MPVLHETDLRVGPTIPKGCLLGDFESSYPFSPEFQVDTHLSDFVGENDISSPFLTCASPVATSISMDTLEDVPNIHDPSTPQVFLEESRRREECEGDAIVCMIRSMMIGMVIMLTRKSV